MAGWSGGGKVIAPGVAHQETIKDIPLGTLYGASRWRSNATDRNPLHEEQLVKLWVRIGRFCR